jgi:hypothetical protein
MGAGHLNGGVDVLLGELFELLSAVNGPLECGGLIGGDALADVFATIPDLMLVVRAGGRTVLGGAHLRFERAILHSGDLAHLLEYLRTRGREVWHRPQCCLDARHFQ